MVSSCSAAQKNIQQIGTGLKLELQRDIQFPQYFSF